MSAVRSLITGELVRYSHSSHERLTACPRRWAFVKLAGLRGESTRASIEGNFIHDVCESYLGGGDPSDVDGYAFWWRRLEPVVDLLPEPGTVEVEMPTTIKDIGGSGLNMLGYLDWWDPKRPYVVPDLKTKGRLHGRYGALSPEQLAEFNQPNVYALALVEMGLVPEPDGPWQFEHVYLTRSGEPEGFRTQTPRDWTDIQAHAEESVYPAANKMAEYAHTAETIGDINQIPANTFSCESYGRRCPAWDTCTARKKTATKLPTLLSLGQNKESDMDLKALRNRYNKGDNSSSPKTEAAPKEKPAPTGLSAEEIQEMFKPMYDSLGYYPKASLDPMLAKASLDASDLGLALDGDKYVPAKAKAATEPDRDDFLGMDFLELREVFPDGVPNGFYDDLSLGRAYGLIVDKAHVGEMTPDELYEEYDRKDTWADVQVRLGYGSDDAPKPPPEPAPGPEDIVLRVALTYLEDTGEVTKDQIKASWRTDGLMGRVPKARVQSTVDALLAMDEYEMDGDKVVTITPLSEGADSTTEDETPPPALGETLPDDVPLSLLGATVPAAYYRGVKDGQNSPGAYEQGFDDAIKSVESGDVEVGALPSGPMRVLCIGCDFAGRRTVPFGVFIAPFAEATEASTGADHYKCVDFGKGPGTVAAKLRAAIRAEEVELPEAISEPSRSHPLIDVVRDVLVTEASYQVVI